MAETGITAAGMSDSTNEARTDEKTGWCGRLAGGLKRTSSALGTAIADLVTKGPLDPAMLDDDRGGADPRRSRLRPGRTASPTLISQGRYSQGITPDEVKAVVAAEVAKILEPVAKPLVIGGAKPFVILVVGVNGSGKTTTIGKLASKLSAEGRKVVLAAGDTFRAAAIDQLKIWGQRTGAKVIAREPGADSAGLAFEALSAAKAEGADVLIVDTAGRLAEPHRADGRAGKDGAGDEEARRRPRRTPCCWCSTPPSARTRCRRSRCSARSPASPAW